MNTFFKIRIKVIEKKSKVVQTITILDFICIYILLIYKVLIYWSFNFELVSYHYREANIINEWMLMIMLIMNNDDDDDDDDDGSGFQWFITKLNHQIIIIINMVIKWMNIYIYIN